MCIVGHLGVYFSFFLVAVLNALTSAVKRLALFLAVRKYMSMMFNYEGPKYPIFLVNISKKHKLT